MWPKQPTTFSAKQPSCLELSQALTFFGRMKFNFVKLLIRDNYACLCDSVLRQVIVKVLLLLVSFLVCYLPEDFLLLTAFIHPLKLTLESNFLFRLGAKNVREVAEV